MRFRVCLSGLLFVSLFLLNSAFAQSRLEIFPLKHRLIEEILPVVEPLLQGEGTVTGMRNQLIVRTSPENLEMIRGILAELDTPMRNIRITVRQGISANRETSSVDVGANIPIEGGKGRIVIPQARRGGAGVSGMIGGNGGAVTGTIDQRRRSLDERHLQHVTTLEGRPATIYLNRRVPVQHTVTQNNGFFSTRSQGITFEDVPTGFSVLPKVNGDRVVIEIHPVVSKLSRRGIQVQEVHTTASGRLGQWIEIGGLMRSGTSDNDRLLGTQNTRSYEDRKVFFKVEIAE